MDSWRAVRIPSLPGRGGQPRVADTATAALVPAASGPAASLYACGITPYDATHLGHAATFLAWDLLVRAWLDAGHQVTYVQNTTDVDDPLLERADRDGEDWRGLADREIARYRGDMEALRAVPPTHLVGAVEAMDVIEDFNGLLSDRGALYELDSDMYYSRASDPEFGTVSGLDVATMLALSAERGGDPGRPGKKDPLDALVWLAARPGEPSWESGFGPGRPGWHVECAAIATHYLGTTFDVQAGGNDLVFPHHEMSASHARVASGSSGAYARSYLHAGMVGLDGGKMSKSRGNLVFVSDLLAQGTDPMTVRLAILAHHYRQDWEWTPAGLAEAQERLARWRAAVTRGLTAAGAGAPAGEGTQAGQGVLAAVRDSLATDLDAPAALAAVDQWAQAVNSAASAGRGAAADAALVRDTLDALLGVAL
ncbi:MAG TPA: cysteine--1-D-myo-inosityl 2-amino-2-deoxy-alpha-D-glucopyranoside ligase [Streptosporangiaceae bacterium]|nr:cysteine--1-D-myo-inosityl 2-amino-2-deoxy-alpha-D-glucopyranoside ligase [Streptosporangiaceae bacterium]